MQFTQARINNSTTKTTTEMKWTEPQPPKSVISAYNHTLCETPLGIAIIEWKGWKEYRSYIAEISGLRISESDSLEDAKLSVQSYLQSKSIELIEFLKQT